MCADWDWCASCAGSTPPPAFEPLGGEPMRHHSRHLCHSRVPPFHMAVWGSVEQWVVDERTVLGCVVCGVWCWTFGVPDGGNCWGAHPDRYAKASCCTPRPRTTPSPEEISILGVMHGVLLWADMNAATPPGSRGRFALCAGPGVCTVRAVEAAGPASPPSAATRGTQFTRMACQIRG